MIAYAKFCENCLFLKLVSFSKYSSNFIWVFNWLYKKSLESLFIFDNFCNVLLVYFSDTVFLNLNLKDCLILLKGRSRFSYSPESFSHSSKISKATVYHVCIPSLLYVIKFVSDLRQVGGFLRVLRLPLPIKLTAMIAEILLKVALNTINQT